MKAAMQLCLTVAYTTPARELAIPAQFFKRSAVLFRKGTRYSCTGIDEM